VNTKDKKGSSISYFSFDNDLGQSPMPSTRRTENSERKTQTQLTNQTSNSFRRVAGGAAEPLGPRNRPLSDLHARRRICKSRISGATSASRFR
jgi:hypothetical protein